MANRKNKKQPVDIATLQPDEIGLLRESVKEFISRLQNVDNEIETLKSDRRELIEEFSEKLDLKSFNLAMKVIKLQNSVERKDAYDLFVEVLQEV